MRELTIDDFTVVVPLPLMLEGLALDAAGISEKDHPIADVHLVGVRERPGILMLCLTIQDGRSDRLLPTHVWDPERGAWAEVFAL